MLDLKLLKDPKQDRVVKDVPRPVQISLTTSEFWSSPNQTNWEKIFYFLQREGKVSKRDLIKLIELSKRIMANEGNLLFLQDPVTIIGDIHGQFFDLQSIIAIGGSPQNNKFLFLGDYVDRGYYSIEVMIFLLCLKVNFPTKVFLLRGNHETQECTDHYSFKQECLYKYDQEIYHCFLEVFNTMPLAAVVNGDFFAVHAGISPQFENVKVINTVD